MPESVRSVLRKAAALFPENLFTSIRPAFHFLRRGNAFPDGFRSSLQGAGDLDCRLQGMAHYTGEKIQVIES